MYWMLRSYHKCTKAYKWIGSSALAFPFFSSPGLHILRQMHHALIILRNFVFCQPLWSIQSQFLGIIAEKVQDKVKEICSILVCCIEMKFQQGQVTHWYFFRQYQSNKLQYQTLTSSFLFWKIGNHSWFCSFHWICQQ